MVNQATQTPSPLKIMTSIAPRGLEHQQRAVASWKALGFDVLSLNCADEIAVLRAPFPDVDFVEATRDGRARTGRPLVYFDDILDYYRKTGDAICGIVNSDIILKPDEAFYDIILREAADALVYGSRVDVAQMEVLVGSVYAGGFDFFFFPRAFADLYPPSEFMLGMTWWDYWVPSAALLRGMAVKRLDSYYAFHELHKINYSPESYLEFGQEFAERMRDVLPAGARMHFPMLDDLETVDIPQLGAYTTRFLERYSIPVTKTQCAAAPYNEAGEAQYAEENYGPALQCFQQALATAPNDPRTLNNLAVMSWQLGDREAAKAFIDKAFLSAPEDRNTVFNYIDIQTALDKHEAALNACQHYLTVRRDDHEMHEIETALKQMLDVRTMQALEGLFDDL